MKIIVYFRCFHSNNINNIHIFTKLIEFTYLQNKTLPVKQFSCLKMDTKEQDTEEKVEKKRKVPVYPGFPELARSDVSIYPSYTKLSLAYRVVCRHRYHWAKVAQHHQFLKELHSFEKLQANALDGVRVHREFSQGILSHKIPPRRYVQKLTPDPLNSHQRMRVEEIISGRVNFSQK